MAISAFDAYLQEALATHDNNTEYVGSATGSAGP